jgi:hypothetical protein
LQKSLQLILFLAKALLTSSQGDQIGRIFACGAIIFFGCFLTTEVAKIFGYFFYTEKMCITLTKKIGPQFGRFFTNSSGHPDPGPF